MSAGIASARLRIASLGLLALFAVSACSDEPPGPGRVDTGTGGPADTGGGGDPDTGLDPDGGPIVDPDGGGDDGGGAGPDVPPPDLGVANPNNPNNASLDTDCDGLSDAYEFSTVYPDGSRTSPTNADTDGDGVSDGVETGVTTGVAGAACQPTALDGDATTRTSPTNADSDQDGIPDGVEDANRNGAVDAGETRPLARDSDGDGIADGVEDINRNGQLDPGETSPINTDSDGDTLPDGVEDSNRNGTREPTETDARSPDTDCDALRDDEELMLMTSPILADTDRDGISDGVELGRTTGVPGATCPGFVPDADPATMTNPLNPDSDMDGVADGAEDVNGDGRVDMGELNPANADSDMDGISDGDEVLAGTNPLDPMSPSPDIRSGVTSICSDANLKVVDFDQDAPGDWTLANEVSTAYAPITVSQMDVQVAALEDSTQQFAGFVAAMPALGGALDANGQLNALLMRIAGSAGAQQLNVVQRSAPRQITSHDSFPTAVSGVFEVSIIANPRNASALRNSLLYVMTGLGAGSFTGLPTNVGGAGSAFVLNFQVLVRPATQRVVVVAAVLDRPAYDSPSNASFYLNDLTNGTALAVAGARRGKACNPFVTAGQAVADFIWMSDISGSTDDDRGRVAGAAQRVFQALATNGVDFRMGVVQHVENVIARGAGNGGTLLGAGFTRSQTDFVNSFNLGGGDGCEFGLDAASSAITRALPRTAQGQPENPRLLREGATLAVVYVSDEYAQEVTEGQCGIDPGGAACNTGIGDVYTTGNTVCQFAPNAAQQACIDQVVAPYIQQIRDQAGVAFAQVINPNPTGLCNQGQFRCPQPGSQEANEPGRGYLEVVNALGGTSYSPCVDDPGQALQTIVDAVTGAASQFQLTGQPISSSIKVGITRMGTGMTQEVLRSKANGFDYDPVANAIFFRGMGRPAVGDRVTVSYRVWLPPEAPCGRPCGPNQICDGQLGVCTCDQGQCNATCGPNQVCDANCACTCTPDCNGNCGPNQVCNQATCACECPADCGGCGPGTVCNPTTCACECDSNCGGACANTPNLVCNTAACNCQCPSDCGGRCGTGLVCNTSTCDCACPPDCDAACGGAGRCDPNNNCACACPVDCGGCPDGTVCNASACACECPAAACANCTGNRVCNPTTGCGCECPADCGGCGPTERCEQSTCMCVPRV